MRYIKLLRIQILAIFIVEDPFVRNKVLKFVTRSQQLLKTKIHPQILRKSQNHHINPFFNEKCYLLARFFLINFIDTFVVINYYEKQL